MFLRNEHSKYLKMSTFLSVVESHFKDLTQVDTDYVGYVEGVDELQKFVDDMRAFGYMFVNRSSNKGMKAYFFQRNGKKHTFQIDFFGPLFQINKNSLYECSQGKTKNRSRISAQDNFDIQNDEYAPPPKKKAKDQSTRKIGCEASMHILELTIFPEYTIDMYVPKGTLAQSNLVKKLKSEVLKTPGPKRFVRFMIKVSQESAHNHSVESSTKTLNLHPKLIEEIKTLTKTRFCSVKEVKTYLKEYVEKTFIRENNTIPDVNNTCFYPTDKVIHFHMHKDKSITSLFYHQEGLMDLVHQWSMLVADDMFMLRLCADNGYSLQDSDAEPNQTFLFCHQASWQKQLLQRYGNNICLLETGVHRGLRDSFMKRIPLYFLSVKTNIGFSCVAWFIIQEKSSDLLQDALSVLLSWNCDWLPQYFLTNCSSSDVVVVQKLFPSTVVYFSPYNREQMWCRWLKVKDNVLSLRSERNILTLWKDIARSRSVVELEKNLNAMKEEDSYVINQKAQDYFNNKWLQNDILHLWIEAYQTEDFLTMIYTSNGMEMQCKAARLSFKAATLIDLTKHIFEDHLPRVFQKYCQSNNAATIMSPFDENDFLPILGLLKDRPAVFVNHVMNHYSTAVRNYRADHVTVLEDCSTFSVTSDFGGGLEGPFVVRLGEPSCSCTDFARWRFPCEHMCAIFAHVPEVQLEQLPSSYLDSPYLTLDKQFSEISFTETEFEAVVFEDGEQVEEIETSGECDVDYQEEYVLVNECSLHSYVAKEEVVVDEEEDEDSMANTVHMLGLPPGTELHNGVVSGSEDVDKVREDFQTRILKVHDMSFFANDVNCLEEGISTLSSFEGKIATQVTGDEDCKMKLVK